MSNDLSSSLEALRSTASRLNTLTNQANESVRLVEQFLSQECSIGIYAFVLVREISPDLSLYLEYRKVGTRFRIAVVEGDPIGEQERITPWSDCNRDTKLETITKLPELINTITQKLNEEIEKAEKATNSVIKSLKMLTGKEG
ncbi:MAG: hypothetical protein AB1560_05075 [Pseudomonadota bacterium]